MLLLLLFCPGFRYRSPSNILARNLWVHWLDILPHLIFWCSSFISFSFLFLFRHPHLHLLRKQIFKTKELLCVYNAVNKWMWALWLMCLYAVYHHEGTANASYSCSGERAGSWRQHPAFWEKETEMKGWWCSECRSSLLQEVRDKL